MMFNACVTPTPFRPIARPSTTSAELQQLQDMYISRENNIEYMWVEYLLVDEICNTPSMHHVITIDHCYQ